MKGEKRLALVAAIGLAAALAAAIGGIAAFSARVRDREISSDVGRGGVVVAFEPAAVRSVDVEVAGVGRAGFVRDGAQWRSEPAGTGDGAAVPELLERLAALRRRTTSASERVREEPAAYGVDRPRVVVQLALADGVRRAAVGSTTGPDGITFVSAPDGTVAIVAADAGEAVVRAATDAVAGPEGKAIPAGQAGDSKG